MPDSWWSNTKERIFSIGFERHALVSSYCEMSAELVCDNCGVTFREIGDYSKELKEDADIQEALGIDVYTFLCPNCRPECASGPVAAYFMSIEDAERVGAYRRGELGK